LVRSAAELAKGKVPAEQARHLITTFGIVASVCGGIGGAVLTLRTASAPVALAFGELVVALAAAALIAACGRGPVRRTQDRADQPKPAGGATVARTGRPR